MEEHLIKDSSCQMSYTWKEFIPFFFSTDYGLLAMPMKDAIC